MTSAGRKTLWVVIVVIVLGLGTWAILYFSGVLGTASFFAKAVPKGTCHMIIGPDKPDIAATTCMTDKQWNTWERYSDGRVIKRTGGCHLKNDPPDWLYNLSFDECKQSNWDAWRGQGPSCTVSVYNLGAGCI